MGKNAASKADGLGECVWSDTPGLWGCQGRARAMLHQRAGRVGVRTKAVCLVLHPEAGGVGGRIGGMLSVTHRAGGLGGEG